MTLQINMDDKIDLFSALSKKTASHVTRAFGRKIACGCLRLGLHQPHASQPTAACFTFAFFNIAVPLLSIYGFELTLAMRLKRLVPIGDQAFPVAAARLWNGLSLVPILFDVSSRPSVFFSYSDMS